MHVLVKILKGQECTLEVREQETVLQVKDLVANRLGVPAQQQRLVFKGKALADDKCLQDYNITDGAKLFLVVKKKDEVGASPSTSEPQKPVLWDELDKLLAKHFRERDARLVLAEFKKDLERNISTLSLDDIERLACANLNAQKT